MKVLFKIFDELSIKFDDACSSYTLSPMEEQNLLELSRRFNSKAAHVSNITQIRFTHTYLMVTTTGYCLLISLLFQGNNIH